MSWLSSPKENRSWLQSTIENVCIYLENMHASQLFNSSLVLRVRHLVWDSDRLAAPAQTEQLCCRGFCSQVESWEVQGQCGRKVGDQVWPTWANRGITLRKTQSNWHKNIFKITRRSAPSVQRSSQVSSFNIQFISLTVFIQMSETQLSLNSSAKWYLHWMKTVVSSFMFRWYAHELMLL